MFKHPKATLSIYIVVLALTIGVGTWSVVNEQPARSAPIKHGSAEQIEKPARARTNITYTAKAGITSLQQLQNEADNVITKDSSYGQYVDAIEGHRGGTDGKYWSFYIDGTLSQIGADTYKQRGGEQITWKFQKLQ